MKKRSDTRITALYARLPVMARKPAYQAVFKIKKPFLKSMQKTITCQIPVSFMMMVFQG